MKCWIDRTKVSAFDESITTAPVVSTEDVTLVTSVCKAHLNLKEILQDPTRRFGTLSR